MQWVAWAGCSPSSGSSGSDSSSWQEPGSSHGWGCEVTFLPQWLAPASSRGCFCSGPGASFAAAQHRWEGKRDHRARLRCLIRSGARTRRSGRFASSQPHTRHRRHPSFQSQARSAPPRSQCSRVPSPSIPSSRLDVMSPRVSTKWLQEAKTRHHQLNRLSRGALDRRHLKSWSTRPGDGGASTSRARGRPLLADGPPLPRQRRPPAGFARPLIARSGRGSWQGRALT